MIHHLVHDLNVQTWHSNLVIKWIGRTWIECFVLEKEKSDVLVDIIKVRHLSLHQKKSFHLNPFRMCHQSS